jgi:hypothetical protein
VSGALDRLHYEKDPCVRYDAPRKVWIYLHRGRTEEDFGMHCSVRNTYVKWYAHMYMYVEIFTRKTFSPIFQSFKVMGQSSSEH